MNGYEIMAASYRQMVKQGRIDKETADKEIRIYDFLATCDTEDICRMVDSSAFNDIIKAFVEFCREFLALFSILSLAFSPCLF